MALVPPSQPNEPRSLIQRLKRALAERALVWADQTLGARAPQFRRPPNETRGEAEKRDDGGKASNADFPDAPPAAWLEYIRQRAPHLIVGGQFRPSSGGTFVLNPGAAVAAEPATGMALPHSTPVGPAVADLEPRREGIRPRGAGTNIEPGRLERGRPANPGRAPAGLVSSPPGQSPLGDALWPRGRRQVAAPQTIDPGKTETTEESTNESTAAPVRARSTASAAEEPRHAGPHAGSDVSSRRPLEHTGVASGHRSDVVEGRTSLDSPAERREDVVRTRGVGERLRRKSTAVSLPGDAGSERTSWHDKPGRTTNAVRHTAATDFGGSSRGHGGRPPGLEPPTARSGRGAAPAPDASLQLSRDALASGPQISARLAGRQETPRQRRWAAPPRDEAAAVHPHTPSTRSPLHVLSPDHGETSGPPSGAAVDLRWPALPTLGVLGPDPVVRDLEARERRARLRREQAGGAS